MRPAIALIAVLAAAPAAAQTIPSEQKAVRLSLWGTVIPVAAGAMWWVAQGHGAQIGLLPSGPERAGPAALIAGGLVLGPALGYPSAYGGRGMRGVGIRAGLTVLSFVPAFAICGWNCSKGDTEYDLAWLAVATGTGLSLASAVYDISRVKRHVRRHNERPPRQSLSFAPVYIPGQRSLGFRLGVTF